MNAALRSRVEAATVRVDALKGQGILVSGGVILTAAHCIKWNGEGGMALGDVYIETVTTAMGQCLKVALIFADPVSDIAALGPLDNQEFGDEAEAFETWLESTAPIRLARKIPPWRGSVNVAILTHLKTWVPAKVTNYNAGRSGRMFIAASKQVLSGTSGGPVVNASGELIGVVSNFNEVEKGKPCNGLLPIAPLALPGWIVSACEKGK